MKLNHLSDLELLHYLELCSTDPVVQRLVTILSTTRAGLVNDLVDAGMDPDTWIFEDDGDKYTPGDYIVHLRSLAQHERDDRHTAEDEQDLLQREVDRLSARNIVDFLHEAKELISNADRRAASAIRSAHELDCQNKELREKLDVWTIMKTD
jgi:hypothetical protein